MIKIALAPVVALAALVPLCSGTVWGHMLLLTIASGILFGTLSLGTDNKQELKKAAGK